jgi:hypothetical protein
MKSALGKISGAIGRVGLQNFLSNSSSLTSASCIRPHGPPVRIGVRITWWRRSSPGHRGEDRPRKLCHDVAGVLPNHDRIASLDALHHTAHVHVKNVVPVIERIRVDLRAIQANRPSVHQCWHWGLYRLRDGALE